MSIVYFFLYGAIGTMVPFLSVYYRNVGLSGTEIGLLLAVSPIVLFVSQPIFGLLTDRSGHRGRMLAILLLAAGLSGALIGFGTNLLLLVPLVAMWAFFSGPVPPIADSIALGEVVRTGVSYPQLRLWGSIGFVFTSIGLGRLYNVVDLRWTFAFYCLFNVTALLFARRLPAEGVGTRRPLLPALKGLLKNPTLIGFLLLSGLLQITQAGHQSFFSIHVENLGGTLGMVGLAWGLAAITEIPVWVYLSRLTRGISPMVLLSFSGFMYGLRWLLVSQAPSATVLLFLQLLQSLSFAIFLPTAVVLVGELVPPELRTSGQALLVLVNSGIAMVVGTVVAGRIVDQAGTGRLYFVMGIIACVAGLGFLLLGRLTSTRKPVVES